MTVSEMVEGGGRAFVVLYGCRGGCAVVIDAAAEREYMFNHMWRQVTKKFYDPEIHGIDWQMYHDEYAKFLPHINNNYD